MSSIIFFKIFATLYGALVGSFLNAVIYRLPREISLIKKQRSHCPKCDALIKWYHNIPMISFIVLRRKCNSCDFKIPWRYFWVELLMAVSFYFLAPTNFEAESLLTFLFLSTVAACFVAHFFIDYDSQILPDSINILLAILFLGFGIYQIGWKSSILGGLFGFLLPLTVTWIFYKLRGQIGLGGGDIKLFGALGFYLGIAGIFQNLFLSCFVGSIIGIFAIMFLKHKKENPMAFGPAIILTSSLQIFFPEYFSQIIKLIFIR